MRLSRWIGRAWITTCIALVVRVAAEGQQAPAAFDSMAEQQLVQLINQERTQRGIAALTVDARLSAAARKHTLRMVQHNQLSHDTPGEAGLQTRFANEDIPSSRQAENIAQAPDVIAVHQNLMNSPHHRDNILNPAYNAVGVAILQEQSGLWVTEDFAYRLPEYSEPQTEAVAQRAIEDYARQHRLAAPVRKPEKHLRSLACKMARNDSLDPREASQAAGGQAAIAWTINDPAELPASAKKKLAAPLPSGYSLGACFAPSLSHPGGVYWLVMVIY